MRILLTVLALAASPALASTDRAALIEGAAPSVLHLNASVKMAQPEPMGFLSPSQDETQTTAKSSGSAFVIDGPNGLVMTASFNVDNATNITLTGEDGREHPAKVVGVDDRTQIAVLRIDSHDLPALSFCTSRPRSGEDVVLIGYPYALGQMAYSGSIAGYTSALEGFDDPLTVLDLNVLRGDSGAPVLTTQGCVTAMAVAIYGAGTTTANLGMAVPSDRLEAIGRELVANGRIARGWIGVSLLKEDGGLEIIEVSEDSPARQVGLREGDVIISYDGTAVSDVPSISRHIASLKPGDMVSLVIRRNRTDRTVALTAGSAPAD